MTTHKKKPSTKVSHEGNIEVLLHRIAYRYWWDGKPELTDEVKEYLEEEAENRAKDCIMEGCHSGELNCYYHNGDDKTGDFKEWELRGWWEIDRS